MSEKFIPEHIEPNRFAEQKLALDGVVKIADMQRLNSTILSTDDVATVHIQFGVDDQGVTFLSGNVKVTLSLQCQRCLEPFRYEIMSDFVLGIINSLEDVNALPEHYEPALTKEGYLALRELIEDEIILNLPIIPRHEPEDCKIQLPLTDSGWEQGKGNNPFHVLQTLKHKKEPSSNEGDG